MAMHNTGSPDPPHPSGDSTWGCPHPMGALQRAQRLYLPHPASGSQVPGTIRGHFIATLQLNEIQTPDAHLRSHPVRSVSSPRRAPSIWRPSGFQPCCVNTYFPFSSHNHSLLRGLVTAVGNVSDSRACPVLAPPSASAGSSKGRFGAECAGREVWARGYGQEAGRQLRWARP